MTMIPRQFPDYAAGLKNAFEEEISGETFFAAMAEAFDGIPAQALGLMAEMERETVRILEPIVARTGVEIADRDALRAEGRAEGLATAAKGWDALVRSMAESYDAYVDEFQQTKARGPDADQERLDLLIDHELAIIDFARAWLRNDANCLAPLHGYLARTAAV